jgi:predicted aspartyl protease
MSSLTLKVQQPSGRLVVRLYLGAGKIYRETLTNRGRQVPVPIHVEALVDTGASRTVVEQGKLVSLGLVPMGEAEIHTASTGAAPVKRNVCKVAISLAEAVTATLADDLEVVAADDLSGLGVDVLLGRDFLRQLEFT